MSGKQFIPNLGQVPEKVSEENRVQADQLTRNLLKLTKVLVISLFALIPIFFTPQLLATLGFSKTLLAIFVGGVSLVILGFVTLRSRQVRTILPVTLGVYAVFLIMSLISALMIGDTLDSVRGSYMEVQTVGFLAVMGLLMLLPLVLQEDENNATKSIFFFMGSAFLVVFYNLVRLFTGPEFLSFSSFSSLTVSPVGTFNDLAIFSTLIIILGIISLIQLPLKISMKVVLSVLVLGSTLLLTVINFFDIWLIVGFFTLLVLVYLLSKDTWFDKDDTSLVSSRHLPVIIITAVIFSLSAVFVVFEDTAGDVVSRIVDVDYVEVVPSIEGTLGIARAVMEDNALLGVGPNRFADAWRLYKNEQINRTIFWDTDFQTGSGFVPTLIINNGLIGGVTFLIFHLAFLIFGYRVLVRVSNRDKHWYYIALISFTGATYLWMMAYIYEPSQTLLLIAALFTGLALTAGAKLNPASIKTVPLITNQSRGFVFMALVVILVSNIVVVLTSVSKQYLAQANFNSVQVNSGSFEEIKRQASESYASFSDDRFAIAQAQIELANINSLLSISEPTEEHQQRFLSSIEQAQIFVDRALGQDSTNPDNHAVLAGIYRALAIAGIDGAKNRAEVAIAEAQKLDPKNPGYYLLSAQMDITSQDTESARNNIEQALVLKPNFAEGLFLLAQLDIREGNTEAAIETTRSIISLEPQNPTRYFQLGMLLAAIERNEEAVIAFNRAIQLDSQFANARYFLALTHLALGESEEALNQLQIVLETNQDNSDLINLIRQIESGETVAVPDLGLEAPVSESVPSQESNVVTSSIDGDTNLLEQLNTGNQTDEVAEEGQATEESTPSEESATTEEPVENN
jgi:tetratricopeptide (TPR) repeat protein